MKRYCEPYIYSDLQKKMVFVGGPRQVGKTTVARAILEKIPGEYLNWDRDQDRKAIQKAQWLERDRLIVFDEIHKNPKWKQWIKGVYDTKPVHQNYLVTGSARLDVYKKGGDSLLGRYHYWRLHPLTLDEFPEGMEREEGYRRLLTLGGFPEPFLSGDLREAKRWRRERFDRIIREDIRDLEQVRSTEMVRLFANALRSRVGGMITLSNLAVDLQISPKTAKEWLVLIENMYIAFAVYPFTTSLPRAIQKPPKVFFFDNADTEENEGMRLENLVATTLLKRLHFMEDYYGVTASLHYLRDKDGREVDFVTVIDGKIFELLEVKTSDSQISSALRYYTKLLQPQKSVQLVGNLTRPYDDNGISVRNPMDYFAKGPWDEVEVKV